MSREQEHQLDKKRRLIAMLTTGGIHTAMLLLLFFIVAFRTPDPPIPDTGVELNFGLDAEGYGDVQPDSPIGDGGAGQPENTQPEPTETQPEPEPVKPEEVKPAVEEKVKTKAPEPTPVDEEEAESTEESPVVVKKKPEEKKKEEVKTPPVEKPKEKVEEKKPVVEQKKVEEKKVEEKKPVVEEQKPVEKPKVVDQKAVYKPGPAQSSGTEGGTKPGEPGNHGDDEGKVGDKGNPKGSLDAKALYGQPGTGGPGAGGNGDVSMSGFNGFERPRVQTPAVPDDAFGVYEFMVKVDDQGEILSIVSLQRGLSLEAERKFKAAIQQLVFVPKGSNLPPVSEGKITFKVVSK